MLAEEGIAKDHGAHELHKILQVAAPVWRIGCVLVYVGCLDQLSFLLQLWCAAGSSETCTG